MSKPASPNIETRLFIGNKYKEAKQSEKITVINPFDQSIVTGAVSCAGPDDVDDAVEAAFAAAKGWAKTRPSERARLMLRLADLVEENSEELAALETMAMGAPLWITKHGATSMAEWFRYYAGWANKLPGETFLDPAEGTCKLSTYEPFGVCAGIAAWNGSLMFVGWKVAPAIAAGNTFVFKCSEKSPLGVLALGKLVIEAGFPPGVINFISGGAEAGHALASHMKIGKISFTGSSAAGRKVQVAAANSNLKQCSLELGGKSAAIVFEDAQLDNALDAMSMGFLVNSTQVCAATTRLLIHENIAETFVESLRSRFESIVLGDPKAPTSFMGPLVDKIQFDRVNGIIENGAKEPGVQVVTGGPSSKTKSGGFFVTPTIFLNPSTESTMWRDEIFGPVLCVRTFKDEDEAIELANDSKYGLGGSIYTSDISRALRVGAELKTGTVSINQGVIPDYCIPFGGWKESGTGREGGKAGIMAYLQSKTISVKLL
ncbi:unnamed protein product [Clonostachys rosea]|uniref:aldehyde dehydrogenase (NAD(+)) n=1 Tax=Bionectria ochroleuca TaxID=29856 RepID=A0ABY6U1Q6_BIOOC|nr:unnamed protein product [Clonostachys rosea]